VRQWHLPAAKDCRKRYREVEKIRRRRIYSESYTRARRDGKGEKKVKREEEERRGRYGEVVLIFVCGSVHEKKVKRGQKRRGRYGEVFAHLCMRVCA